MSAMREQTTQRATTLMFALVAALTGSACAGTFTPPRAAFTHSSLDAHAGAPHTTDVVGVAPEAAVDLVVRLAKERELVLVRSATSCARGCVLAFRSKPQDKRVFRAAGALRRSYYSRYFVTLAPRRGGTRITAVGVPVLDGEMACPAKYRVAWSCRAPELTHARGVTLQASVHRAWGYDISGRNEAETLSGWLAELARARITKATPNASALAPRRGARPIVAVFDIEDRTGASSRSVREQLSAYLSASVTKHAGFKVVPRAQLRRRIKRAKRESYKRCYDQRCQIEIGKAIAAQKTLSTQLIKVGKQCALTASLYDLRSETAERAASTRTSCTPEALLEAIDKLARQL